MAASSSTSTRNIIVGTAAACTLGVIGYALYFDYKRRNDLEFRKQLKKQQKKVSTSKAKDLLNDTTATLSNPNLKAALAQVKREPMPVTQEASERYFMEHVGIGEQLASNGPQYYLEAAVEMYKALRVYPVPHELLAIFEKTLPGEVNKLVVQLLSMDVSDPSGAAGEGRAGGAGGSATPPTIEELDDALSSSAPASDGSHEWEKLTDSVKSSS